MKVLINAYSCSPNRGSEAGIGWNWSTEIAKYCQVIIITEGQDKNEIEDALQLLPQRDNIRFIYHHVPERVREMCRNQGDWRFYWYYHQWQKNTYKIALDICSNEKIDVIHQLTMQGFREPGFLWKIKGPKFVWGPIGGMENMPLAYLEGASMRMKAFCFVKNSINWLQFRFQPNVRKALHHADALIASTSGGKVLIKKHHHLDSLLINDTGCNPSIYKGEVVKFNEDGYFHLIWVGKFDFRKQLGLALKIMAELKGLKVKLHILGSGNTQTYKRIAKNLGVDENCIWHGQVDHDVVNLYMQKSDLFLFTSIHEATSTVIVEAIQNHLPIVCFNTCGFGTAVTNDIGVKLDLKNPALSVHDFADAICGLYNHPERIRQMSNKCPQAIEKLTWASKAKKCIELYYGREA